MQSTNPNLKKGLNIFYCEFDYEHEEGEDVKYIYNLYVCHKNTIKGIIEETLKIETNMRKKLKENENFIVENFKNFDNSIKMKI